MVVRIVWPSCDRGLLDVTDVIPDGAGGLWVATRGGVAHLAAPDR